jgi:hypothetical protein
MISLLRATSARRNYTRGAARAADVPHPERSRRRRLGSAALELERPICDPRHHLWDLQAARLVPRYLLDEIVVGTRASHNIVSTAGAPAPHACS